jgi:hemerythrin
MRGAHVGRTRKELGMLLQWSKDLAVGHPIIDSDHQMLVNIANDLAHAAETGASTEATGMALGRLVQYIATHFRREEALFMDSHYPNKEKHLKNHQVIENLVQKFQTRYAEDPASVDLSQLLDFLKEWLVQHIGKMDKGYAPHVHAAEKKHAHMTRRTGFA